MFDPPPQASSNVRMKMELRISALRTGADHVVVSERLQECMTYLVFVFALGKFPIIGRKLALKASVYGDSWFE
jgi:hypothetical protein